MENNIEKLINSFLSKYDICPDILINYDSEVGYIISISINDFINRTQFINLAYIIYNALDDKTDFTILLFINKILKYKYSTVYLSDFSEIHVDRIIEEVKDLVNSFKGKDRDIRKFLLPMIMLEYSNFFSAFYEINSWRGFTENNQISYNKIEEE